MAAPATSALPQSYPNVVTKNPKLLGAAHIQYPSNAKTATKLPQMTASVEEKSIPPHTNRATMPTIASKRIGWTLRGKQPLQVGQPPHQPPLVLDIGVLGIITRAAPNDRGAHAHTHAHTHTTTTTTTTTTKLLRHQAGRDRHRHQLLNEQLHGIGYHHLTDLGLVAAGLAQEGPL